MQHADTKPLLAGLPGQRFLDEHLMLTGRWHSHRERIPLAYRYRVFYEFPISFGTNSPKRCPQVDAMIHASLDPGGLVYLDDQQIAVEIKQTHKDLCRYDMAKYNCVADFYYLAVTHDLLSLALCKASANPIMGVVDITTGDIHRLATYTGSSDRRLINLQVMMSHYALKMPAAARRYLLGPTFGYVKSTTDDGDGDKEIMTRCYWLRQQLAEACVGKEDDDKLMLFRSLLRQA